MTALALSLFALITPAALADDSSTQDVRHATRTPDADRPARVDIEVDPLAYALGGASLHGGLHLGAFRFDLGVFSLPLPEALHGNPGFSAQGHGYGLKADWFAGPQNTRLHLGGQVDITLQTVTHDATTTSSTYREVATGGRVGYRLQHRSGLYVDPWVGLVYRISTPTEIALGGERYTQSKLMPFPTIHVGWRL